ncbi:glutamine--fructose-6-phosphate transaminase (isomerizing) [Sulfurisphaera ohwakuensis]|uniref:glutamine--fructose-6-phosphate transaminase (isomerizing) n=1 Tax=Sulfurisphaera ohwakuensis TaxID=69656 RepID=A0A650CJV5_SULOH|nr:glutamine--fructose-6-phosphate transaminase (isomerizing) [Sulfurisphaera ohwakuensis]MBB5254531.1 glucosamine--fructose-6-phosphate aminotransferase (isomerizing) [Sulfurisphaera ohwakuensis]QGR18141.1 glutamine--fructose-6-phosphate transaminase (isomerizing) [Sulfurisphaera ohwakuensis]
MGGIFGFICKNPRDVSIINIGLKRLIYRGYDSAGIVYEKDSSLEVIKMLGNIAKSEIKVNDKSKVALGHTRYASRGWPTLNNAHPITDCKGEIGLVMDGILYDYEILREKLEREGHKFVTTTDTEVLPHYLEGNYEEKLKGIWNVVRGLYSFAFIVKGVEKIFAVNAGQGLYIGISNGCFFISSDLPSLTGFAENAIIVPENTYVILSPDSFKIFNTQGEVDGELKRVKYKEEIADKGGFSHFMLKEIYDIPFSLINSVNSLMEKYLSLASMIIANARKVYIIANGSSLHAGYISSYYLHDVSLNVVSAAEFPYYALDNITTGTVVIAISQSGETSDVIRSVKLAKQRGAVILGITNSVGSRLALESNVYLPITAGPELAVPATKTFTSTIVVLKILSDYVSYQLGKIDKKDIDHDKNEIQRLSKLVLDSLPYMEKRAEELVNLIDKESLYVASSGINYPIALEGALKFKEASLTHAEGVQLGELLHGPIVLANKGYPILVIKPAEEQAEDLYNKVIKLAKDRGSPIITISPEGDFRSVKTTRDLSPIANVIPLQLLSYKLGVKKELPIDTPVGLVKAVTI